jgi:SAM-dependent methyltransferase
MVVSSAREPISAPAPTADVYGQSPKVVWHDLECGSYRADLPLWRALAEREGDPLLDIGAGTGRVALALAAAGHRVTALDVDPDLLGALRDRSDGLPVQTVCADACSFELPRQDFALCLVPMQTIQLLEDASARMAFLRCAHAHLRPGGLLACAIVTELEPFDIAEVSAAPSAETARVGEALYVSQAESVRVLPRRIVIGRSRRILSPAARRPSGGISAPESRERDSARGPTETTASERNVVELARVGVDELEREGSGIGFHPEPALVIEPTEEHVGSVVVMLRA